MRCVAIDDEPVALSIISQYVKRVDDIELYVYSDPVVGIKEIKRLAPDFVFLDIEMGGVNGIDIAKELPTGILLVFTTAYAEYALDGFELNAVDFLHKPFSFSRFVRTVDKIKELIKLNTLVNNPVLTNEKITIKVEYKNIAVNLADILYIEAMDNYVRIHLTGSKHLLSQMSMKGILQLLPRDKFVRIHKSFIIPVHKVAHYSKTELILFEKNIKLPIGRTYIDDFLKSMN